MGTRALLSSTALYRKQLYWVYPLGAGGIAILQYTEHLCTTPVRPNGPHSPAKAAAARRKGNMTGRTRLSLLLGAANP